ncbi:MAG: outer membrane lipoprotein chaperone LolA [candidate division NC10 bacterium]|nr:outer membrane lipoprotein chaperone LolA [candidate division NC10 bacterium]
MRTRLALLLAAALLLPGAAPADVPDLVARIEARYRALSTLQGRYLQTATLQAAGQTERATGKFFLKRPAMMRWEQESPEPRLLVTDGTTLWSYSPLDKQAIAQPVGPALTGSPSLHFLSGMATLGATFTVASVLEDPAGAVLFVSLTPKSPDPAVRRLVLRVHRQTALVDRLTVVDAYENATVLEFSALRENPRLPDSLFTFRPPPGTDVIRPSSPEGIGGTTPVPGRP